MDHVIGGNFNMHDMSYTNKHCLCASIVVDVETCEGLKGSEAC